MDMMDCGLRSIHLSRIWHERETKRGRTTRRIMVKTGRSAVKGSIGVK
jgi:hypothetical protein